MTVEQAIRAKLSIKQGQKIKTFGGWCRQDQVLLDGHVIGRIQTRHSRDRTENITIAGNVYMIGFDVDWLYQMNGGLDGTDSTPERGV